MRYQLPLKGIITSRFGKRKHPVTGKQSFHNGVDISAPAGTHVQAPDSGRISEVWDHDTGGKCIAMVGRTGIRFGFAHLSNQLHSEGDIVNIGDVIAESGNSGSSTGPHLHFTVKVNGNWVNPETYFKF
jgi:murein DD-endopeptidase MepM/ murein hydrolase activator NlpD